MSIVNKYKLIGGGISLVLTALLLHAPIKSFFGVFGSIIVILVLGGIHTIGISLSSLTLLAQITSPTQPTNNKEMYTGSMSYMLVLAVYVILFSVHYWYLIGVALSLLLAYVDIRYSPFKPA